MAAFKKARECGSPGIELDIHVTRDGKLAVVHDDNFLRTGTHDNNGNGKKPEELNYSEIKKIDVGSFFGSEWSFERPPLLEEVLEEFCPGMYVDIELKTRKTKDDPLPVLLAEKCKALGKKICTAITVSSFNPFALKTFKANWNESQATETAFPEGNLRSLSRARRVVPEIPAAIIWCSDKEVPWILRRGFGRLLSGCDYVKPIYKQVSRFSVYRYSVLEKRPVIPWTVDDAALAEKMLKAGCEGIITNRPQDLIMSSS